MFAIRLRVSPHRDFPARSRVAVVVTTFPSLTATEIGVALCFTPVGTASTNDYIAFAGIQLVRNSSLASDASATAGTSLGYNCPGNSGQSSAIIELPVAHSDPTAMPTMKRSAAKDHQLKAKADKPVKSE